MAKGNKGVAKGDKKPYPKTWHDVDPNLGKQVDKMTQAEKVEKGLAHPDTLKKSKEQGVAEGLSEMDNRTSSGDRREKRNNSPEEKAKQDKEQQKRLTATSPEMRKKLRLLEPKQGVAENKLLKPYKKWAS
jgi:hypothetical protein